MNVNLNNIPEHILKIQDCDLTEDFIAFGIELDENDSLPIVIDGTSYFNAVLKYKKQNKVLVDTSKKIVSKNALKQVSKSKQETKNIKEKTVDKKVNNFVYLWLLLIPVAMYIYRQIKNKLLL